MKQNVANGAFNMYVQEYALVYNLPVLASANSNQTDLTIVLLSESPSTKATFSPSIPSLSPPPVPTAVMPSMGLHSETPMLSFKPISPSIFPSLSVPSTVAFLGTQIINNVDYNDYLSGLPNTLLAIQKAIIDCISVPYGATKSNIVSFNVTNTRRLSSSSRRSLATVPSGNIKLNYKIVIVNTPYSGEEIVYTMKQNVANGAFNMYVQEYALVYNLPVLASANSNQTDLTIMLLSESPTAKATFSPSIPSLAPSPVPTAVMPSMGLHSETPMLSFKPISPTIFPSLSVPSTVAFLGTQIINNVDYNDYLNGLPNSLLAIQKAIIDCISVPYGATTSNIVSFNVTNTRRLSSSSRRSLATVPSGNIKVNYKIVIANTPYSGEEIVYTMKQNIANGAFNMFVQEYALVYNSPVLASANSNQTDLTIVLLTESPTVSSSQIPQAIPSQSPSSVPTAIMPSMVLHSETPMLSFKPISPTIFPSLSVPSTVAFLGTQIINNVDYNDYLNGLPDTSNAIQDAILDCVFHYGATDSDFVNFNVTSNTRRLSSSSRKSLVTVAPSGNIKVNYKMVIPSTPYSGEEIVYTMKQKVADGSFDVFLKIFGLPAFASATSNQTSIVLLSETPSVKTTVSPSQIPQVIPSQSPTEYSTEWPSRHQTEYPTIIFPTKIPQVIPSQSPNEYPTEWPSMTEYPTKNSAQTASPSQIPFVLKSVMPTTIMSSLLPSWEPTVVPSADPTGLPVTHPTELPVFDPTGLPVSDPTGLPVTDPTGLPVSDPTRLPVFEPTTMPMLVYEPTSMPFIDMQYNWEKAPENGYTTGVNTCVSNSASGVYISALSIFAKEGQPVYVSIDSGTSWGEVIDMESSQYLQSPVNGWSSVIVSSSGTYLAVISGPSSSCDGSLYSQVYALVLSSSGPIWKLSTGLPAICYGFWRVVYSGNEQYMYAIFVNNKANVYMSSDYGVSWSVSTASKISGSYTGVVTSATGQYVTVIDGATISTSTDYGSSWTTSSSSIIYCNAALSIASSSSSQFMVLMSPCSTVDNSAIYTYTTSNYGETWVMTGTISVGNYPATISITMSSSGQYSAVSFDNEVGIYISSDFGSSWSLETSAPTNVVSLSMSGSGSEIVAGTMEGNIYLGTSSSSFVSARKHLRGSPSSSEKQEESKGGGSSDNIF